MRILVVEDEHKIARAIARALEQESYAVDIAFDGDEGYAMATTEPYDLVIVDRMIPGDYDGIAIIAAMRESKIHTPAMILTALDSTADKTKGLDSGADDYMTKPFAVSELLARVRALLRRPQAQIGTVLRQATSNSTRPLQASRAEARSSTSRAKNLHCLSTCCAIRTAHQAKKLSSPMCGITTRMFCSTQSKCTSNTFAPRSTSHLITLLSIPFADLDIKSKLSLRN
jgi:DNA-binding response OmpR family regulator